MGITRLCPSAFAHGARSSAWTLLMLGLSAAPLAAQRWWDRFQPTPWTVLLAAGGSYAMSDLEIVPGTDQNGGWTWDAGLRLEHGRGSLGVGFERSRFDIGSDGSGTTSGVFLEPRLTWGGTRRGAHPYMFAHGARVIDYDVTFCCSVYTANSNARGWLFGGGFGIVTAPVGRVRFDLNAGVSRLSAESPEANLGSWKSAGPVVSVRFGASVPLTK